MLETDGRLAGKVATVTGAGSRADGICIGAGRATAALLARHRARWVTGIVLPVNAGASAAPSAHPGRSGENAAR